MASVSPSPSSTLSSPLSSCPATPLSVVIDRCNPRFDPYDELEPMAHDVYAELSRPSALRELREWKPVPAEEGTISGIGGGVAPMPTTGRRASATGG